jgi:dTMP kinase
MPTGRFITLEGSEGCGKSTQARLLEAWLRAAGLEVLLLREPGGTPLGEEIRTLLKHHPAGHGMDPAAELLLFAASRAELVRKVIQPALTRGAWVLCDRFLDSTTVYQGTARGLDPTAVASVNRFAIAGCLPNLTLVFDLDPAEARRRTLDRSRSVGTDRMESEPPAFYETVHRDYLRLAASEPGRFRVVPAHGTPDDVFHRVQQEVRHAFPGRLD